MATVTLTGLPHTCTHVPSSVLGQHLHFTFLDYGASSSSLVDPKDGVPYLHTPRQQRAVLKGG